jgi:cell division protein FtsL
MLAGIVAMQVEQLKLGASIGRSVQRSSALAIRNEQLQASVAALADDQRIERMAAQMGMVMTPPTAVGFLSAGKAVNVQNALGNLQAPNATTFLNSPSTNGIVVTPTSLAAANAAPGSTTGSSSTSGATSPTSPLTPSATSAATTTSAVAPTTGTVVPTTTSSTASTPPVGG